MVLLNDQLGLLSLQVRECYSNRSRLPCSYYFSRSVLFDDFVGNLGSTTCPDVDPLTLLHKRTVDSAVDFLREAVRTQLI